MIGQVNTQQPQTEQGTNYIKLNNGFIIQWGSISIPITSSGGVIGGYYGYKAITFPIAFTKTPSVMTNIVENAGYWNASVYSPSTTGCTIYGAGDRGVTQTIYWTAVGF